MKIKLLLLTAVIALASSATVSANSDHRYKDQRNQSFGHVEHYGHRTVDTYNRLFSFSLVVPSPSYYMPYRSYAHHDYRNEYRYRDDHKRYNNRHHKRDNHHDRNNHHDFRSHR